MDGNPDVELYEPPRIEQRVPIEAPLVGFNSQPQ
jgi:hypothetical protein